MTDENTPPIQISTRPFLDFASGTAAVAQPAAANPRENAHLFAAATGRPRLHPIEADEYPAPAEQHTAYQAPAPLTRRAAATTQPAVSTYAGALDAVDWDIVGRLTKDLTLHDGDQTRTLGSFDVAIADAGPETPYERQVFAEINKLVNTHAEWIVVQEGMDRGWSDRTRTQYVQAIFDEAFRYGRVQQYLREPDIEDVSVTAYDNVMVTKTNGRKERRLPIAKSDDDLERMIADISASRGRAFARPGGHIDLDIGGARLWAVGATISNRTNLTLRKHNLVDISFADLIAQGTMTQKVADALEMIAAANASALVAGYPAAGKTTFLRAWMSTLNIDEKIVTIETEHELYLDKMPHRHSQVSALQYVPSQFSGSDSLAAFSLQDAFEGALRASAQRILFGEMRGPEAPIAIKAMQAGRGSISTLHARSADDAIHRLADMLMSEEKLSSDTVPLRQILRSIDVVIYLDFVDNPDGTRRRVITEVAEIRSNDNQEPMAANLFEWNHQTGEYIQPEKPSNELQRLIMRHNPGRAPFWETR